MSLNSKVKKKICFVIPSLQAGGMERVMSELASYFAEKADIELHMILYGISREIFYPIHGNIIIHKPLFTFNNELRFLSTLRTLWYLRKTIIRLCPVGILSFGEYWNNFVLLSVLGLKHRSFISDRSQPDKSLGLMHNFLRYFLYKTAYGLIFQTERAKEIFLTRHTHPNIAVIGNPIRIQDQENSRVSREKNVLMVGRLIRAKHQDLLIEMFARVSPPDWNLIIVGYDHLKQQNLGRLKELAIELKVEDRVIFTGKIDNVDHIYIKCSIFAFTSSSEGFPNVIGEAMAAGLPVIAYDCMAGPSEMISNGYNGFLIPLFDNQMFESKLSLLMQDKSLREKLGSNAKESIKKFSHEKICEDFYNFIVNHQR
jgi:GalNAc-alpha-(1->4)-GalNAc-alpha-(1->3)-diNAcBac-PP-undecaprenol alpha-1,4-N-acetyl-D-galactosaminyltransferase